MSNMMHFTDVMEQLWHVLNKVYMSYYKEVTMPVIFYFGLRQQLSHRLAFILVLNYDDGNTS